MQRNYLILQLITAIILFIGGIAIIFTKIPFWSLFLGIPSIQGGIVMMIFSFDRLSRWPVEERFEKLKKLEEEELNNTIT